MSAAPSFRRRAVPTVIQMEAVECGAAALAMVLAYHGRYVPLEEIRLACGVSRDGSKANNVLRAARSYGLVARGFKKEPADLAQMRPPMILHWNFNHFVVLEGFRRRHVYLNDPGCGPVRVSAADLDQAFTGVVLAFEPGPEFVRGGERAGFVVPLRRRLTGMGAALAYVVLAGLALLLPGFASPGFSKVFVDDVLVRGADTWLTPLLLIMAASGALTFALTLLQQRYLLRLENALSLGMSSRFLWHVLHLPVEFFTQRYAGEIAGRVAINDRIARLLSGDLATTTLSLLVIAGYAALLFQYDAVLAFASVVTGALNIVVLRCAARARANLSTRMQQDRGKLIGTAMGGLQTIETLKATGSESDFFARWSGYQAKVANAMQALQVRTTVLMAVPPFLLAVNTGVILGLGGLRVMDGHLTMGALVAFQSLMLAFLLPLNRMVQLGSTLQEVKVDLTRLDDVLRASPDGSLQPCAGSADGIQTRLAGQLELRNVSFGYSRLDPPLIEGFSLSIKPGQRVALVGGSGSGKSTIARMVSGLYQPWSGEIQFDGMPRQVVPRRVMNTCIAVVDQDICLFEGSVRDNLTLWGSTGAETDLVEAARDACIHDDIAARPGGYASLVQEGGSNFSGGQRQRMEIARALTGTPRILVLDEATSALDPTTEKQIDDNLRRRGCTCLIIAHRLSTIRDCDEIIVMDKGKIVQRGTHEQLMAVPGHYSGLIASE
ncbi:MAG TPA: NHLP family bacteriocin export ABC transporter peptidase/permease/ATPase subunit [Vicinamibacterales bacterium]